jgi:anti-sigma B factor antagonist
VNLHPVAGGLDVSVWRDGARTVVEVAGEIDAYSSPRLREVLAKVSAEGLHLVAVDMSQVTFMDSSGLGVLVGAVKRARAGQGAVCLFGCAEHVLRVLRITGLVRVMPPFASRDEALAHLDADLVNRGIRSERRKPVAGPGGASQGTP